MEITIYSRLNIGIAKYIYDSCVYNILICCKLLVNYYSETTSGEIDKEHYLLRLNYKPILTALVNSISYFCRR